MKTILLFSISILFGTALWGQSGIGVPDPDPSAVLEMRSNNKGFLMPRLTTAGRQAIVDPAEGLQVYDLDVQCLMIYREARWDCYPRQEAITSRLVVLTFDNITSIGGADNAAAISPGVTIDYNPDLILEVGSTAERIRFLRAGKYEINLMGLVYRADNGNTYQSVGLYSVSNAANHVVCYRENPGAYPSHNSYISKKVINVAENEEFFFRCNKITQATNPTTTIQVRQPRVLIKLIN